MSIDFHYHALVYVYGADVDRPEVVEYKSLTNSFTCSLSDLDCLGQLEDEFETAALPPGMYEVWIDASVEFTTYDTADGLEHDQEVHIKRQVWSLTSQSVIDLLCCPDVAPITIFYSKTPVPDPDWVLHGMAKDIQGLDDAPPTHNVWRRVDDDGKTLYQVSRIEDKMPTLRDGAYFNLHPVLFCKNLYLTLLITEK